MTAAVCGVLVLSGCSSDDSEPEVEGPTVLAMPVSKSALLIAGDVDEPSEEKLTGKPVFVNGCLGAQNGTTTFLVVWPDGTNVASPDADALEYEGEVLEPGSSFTGRGTFVTSKPFPEEFPTIPLKCLSANQEKIMWLQEIDEITE
jgi:hypothetical protein